MKAKELMNKKIFSIKKGQSLMDAAKLMWENDCGWAPIIDQDGRVQATITDRDIAMAAYLNGTRLSDIPLEKVQSKSAVTCRWDHDIDIVEEIMQGSQVRRLPVVDKENKLIGVIALNDIALAYKAGKKGVTAEGLSMTLAAICNHDHGAHPMAAVA
jgi:CBS domain-containing protein